MAADTIEKSVFLLILFISSLLNSVILVPTVHRACKIGIPARGATLYVFTSIISTAWNITESSSVCALRTMGSVCSQSSTYIWQGWSRFHCNSPLILATPNWKLQLLLCTSILDTHLRVGCFFSWNTVDQRWICYFNHDFSSQYHCKLSFSLGSLCMQFLPQEKKKKKKMSRLIVLSKHSSYLIQSIYHIRIATLK